MAMSQQSLPPVNQYTGSFTEDTEVDGVCLNAYGHEDVVRESTFRWHHRLC